MNRYKDKVVVVTGGDRGLGAATVRRFAEEGARVVINYYKNEAAARKLADELGANASIKQTDVADEAAVEAMMKSIADELGKIDILVNNAGIVFDIPFKEKTTEQWKRTLDVNVYGVYYCTKHVLPHMRKGGSVVNISSTNGIDTYHPDSIDYDVSKAAVIMFTKAMARDLAPDIRINSVAPGWFDTDMNADLPQDYVDDEIAKIAMGRIGKPEEIASVVAFLASDDASFVTGATLVVDGGYGGAV